MGYNYQDRFNRVESYFEAASQEILHLMKKDNIKYIVIPQKPIADFTYRINKVFLDKSLKKAYKDDQVIVYQL
jgi:peptide subunit release factor 1 (eRF1)